MRCILKDNNLRSRKHALIVCSSRRGSFIIASASEKGWDGYFFQQIYSLVAFEISCNCELAWTPYLLIDFTTKLFHASIHAVRRRVEAAHMGFIIGHHGILIFPGVEASIRLTFIGYSLESIRKLQKISFLI